VLLPPTRVSGPPFMPEVAMSTMPTCSFIDQSVKPSYLLINQLNPSDGRPRRLIVGLLA
jgi:hypothetical protein